MILFDTDVFIKYLKGNIKTKTRLEEIELNNIAISSISAMKLYYGALNKNELSIIKRAISQLKKICLDVPISKKALPLIEHYPKSHNLKIPDALIAATAIENEISLLTYNNKDFKFNAEMQLSS